MDFDEVNDLKFHKNEEHLNGHFNKQDQSTTNVIYVTVYKCDVCDMDFDEVNDLKSHKTEKHMNCLSHQQDVPISNFKGEIEINMPKNVTKESQYPYKCQVCDKGFKRVSAKNAHLMRNHQVDDNFRPGVTFKCDICAEKFNLQFKLKLHKLEKHNFLSVVKPKNGSLVKPKLENSDDGESQIEFKPSNIQTMVIWVVEFSSGGYKIRKIFALKSTYPKKIIEL